MSPLIEIAISLVLIYLLMAILVSGFGELWSTLTHKRPRMLKEAMDRFLVGDLTQGHKNIIFEGLRKDAIALQPIKDSFTDKLMETLTRGKLKSPNFPSWIDPGTFSQSLVGFVMKFDAEEFEAMQEGQTYNPAPRTGGPIAGDRSLDLFMEQLDEVEGAFRNTLETGQELPPVFNLLDSLTAVSENLDELETNLSDWFNQYTSTMGTDYKKDMRWPLFFSAAVLTMVMNVDTINLVKELWHDDNLRESVVAQADGLDFDQFSQTYLDSSNTDPNKHEKLGNIFVDLNSASEEIEALGLPIGWDGAEDFGINPFKDTMEYVFESRGEDLFKELEEQAVSSLASNLVTKIIESEDSTISISFERANNTGVTSVNNTINTPSEIPTDDAVAYFKDNYQGTIDEQARRFLSDPSLISDTINIVPEHVDSLIQPFVSGPELAVPEPVEANQDSLGTEKRRLVYALIENKHVPEPILLETPEGYAFNRFLTQKEKDAHALSVEVSIQPPENGEIRVYNYRDVNPFGWLLFWEVFTRNLSTITGSQLMGWFITAFAASLGAPFWFDLLKKLLNIRSGTKTKEEE